MSNIRQDASYIITGGEGGLGRSITTWLASEDARYIILASQSAARNPKVQELVLKLKTMGVQVSVHNCDVTVRNQIDSVLKLSQRMMPPIQGAIHDAMVLNVRHLPFILPTRSCLITSRINFSKIRHYQNIMPLSNLVCRELSIFIKPLKIGPSTSL